MSAVNDGGTAFPMQDPQAISAYASARVAQLPEGSSADERARVYLVARAEAAGGMTVRDHFAGLAMAAIISNTTWFDKITEVQARPPFWWSLPAWRWPALSTFQCHEASI